MGRRDEAVEQYHNALRLKPNLAIPHNSLGNLAREAGRLEQALAWSGSPASLIEVFRRLTQTLDRAAMIARNA